MKERLVRRADNRPVVYKLLHAVCAPAYAAPDRKKRRIKIARNVEHVVNEPRVKVDVGTDVLGAGMKFFNDRGAELLDHLIKPHLVKTVLRSGELLGLAL